MLEEHTTTAVHRIQNTINKVCSWTESWALQLNTTKTVSTLFTLSTAKEKVSLKWNNQPVPQVETPTFLGVTPDTRLTWKPHLEAVEAKATRKLAIMKKLAGTTWGGQLRHPKTGLHRGCRTSRRVYTSATWDTASKTNKSKLVRVQNMGLRIILGVMRSTPNPTNGKDCKPSTFGAQTWIQRCHPRGKAEETDQPSTPPETSAWYQKPPEKKELQAQVEGPAKENADLLESDPGKNVRNSQRVSGHRRRAFQKSELKFHALQQREHRLQNCRKHPHWRWYRIAILRAPGPTSSQMALQRMLLGMEAVVPTSVAQMEQPPPSPSQLMTWAPTIERKYTPWKLPQHSWLLSDSLSAFQSLTNGPTDLHTQQLHNSLCTLSDNNRVVLQWVPARVGIAGNETADRLAKAGAKLPQPHRSTSYKEVKTLLKQKQKSA